jgi:hypothetical protein
MYKNITFWYFYIYIHMTLVITLELILGDYPFQQHCFFIVLKRRLNKTEKNVDKHYCSACNMIYITYCFQPRLSYRWRVGQLWTLFLEAEFKFKFKTKWKTLNQFRIFNIFLSKTLMSKIAWGKVGHFEIYSNFDVFCNFEYVDLNKMSFKVFLKQKNIKNHCS